MDINVLIFNISMQLYPLPVQVMKLENNYHS